MKKLLLEEHYSFCSTQVNAPDEMKNDLLRYGDLIDEEDINHEAGGKEDEPHVTILYGIKSIEGLRSIEQNLEKIRKFIKSINITLCEVSAFENDEFDVLKIAVESKELKALHKFFKGITEWESDYPDYKPHLTIAYLKPGTAKKYVGDKRFEGKTFSSDKFLFCNNNGEKTPISLSKTPVKEVAMNYKEFFINEGKYAQVATGRNFDNVKLYSLFSRNAQKMFPSKVTGGIDANGRPTEGLVGEFKAALSGKHKTEALKILKMLEMLVKPAGEHEFFNIYKPAFLRAISTWK